MEEQETRRLPNWLHNEEQHMKIKRERQLVQYQVRMFTNERNKMQKRLDKLNAGQEMRKEAYKITYHNRKELDDAYMVGAIDDREYMRQRSTIWLVYSDRGYGARIEWLDEMIDRYQGKLDQIESWMDERRKASRERVLRKMRMRQKQAAYKRKVRGRARREADRERYREKKNKWKYYGLR